MKTNISFGFTSVKETNSFLLVTHCGNMGNTIEKSVDPNLKKMGFQSIAKMKIAYPKFKETGSPDYSYSIKFKKTNRVLSFVEDTRRFNEIVSREIKKF